nr:MAG TPA: hypothetical protein [Caudoviricetes sp.]
MRCEGCASFFSQPLYFFYQSQSRHPFLSLKIFLLFSAVRSFYKLFRADVKRAAYIAQRLSGNPLAPGKHTVKRFGRHPDLFRSALDLDVVFSHILADFIVYHVITSDQEFLD